jgi:hypothetical protein
VEDTSFSYSVDISGAIEELQGLLTGLPAAQLNAGLTEEELAQWDLDDDAERASFRNSVREMAGKEAHFGGWEVAVVRGAAESILSIARQRSPGHWQFMDFDGAFRQGLNANIRETPLDN